MGKNREKRSFWNRVDRVDLNAEKESLDATSKAWLFTLITAIIIMIIAKMSKSFDIPLILGTVARIMIIGTDAEIVMIVKKGKHIDILPEFSWF